MALTNNTKVPVTVLTGFLGSGKTTLLNHILHDPNHGLKFAVVENEFGAIGIDDELVKMKQESSEEIIEMMNGCICCNVRGDLIPIIKKILARKGDFDAIIIETTGLADPAPVIQTFFIDDEIAEQCKLDGVITVVDSKHIMMHLEEEKPEGATNEAVEQIAFANRILVNKTDLVEADELAQIKKSIKTINIDANIIESQYSKVDPLQLLNIDCFSLEKVLEMEPKFLEEDDDHDHDHDHGHDHGHGHGHGHGHDHGDDHAEEGGHHIPAKKAHERGMVTVHDNRVGSISWRFEGDIVVSQLERLISILIREKGNDLYRYKGVLSVAGKEEKFVFQGVHMVFDCKFMEKWGENEKRESKFVFIGKDLNKENIVGAFEAIKAAPLRFAVGTKVQANVGQFKDGTVIKCWDDGNPYRLQLEDGSEVWAPVDNDMYIRLPK